MNNDALLFYITFCSIFTAIGFLTLTLVAN